MSKGLLISIVIYTLFMLTIFVTSMQVIEVVNEVISSANIEVDSEGL